MSGWANVAIQYCKGKRLGLPLRSVSPGSYATYRGANRALSGVSPGILRYSTAYRGVNRVSPGLAQMNRRHLLTQNTNLKPISKLKRHSK